MTAFIVCINAEKNIHRTDFKKGRPVPMTDRNALLDTKLVHRSGLVRSISPVHRSGLVKQSWSQFWSGQADLSSGIVRSGQVDLSSSRPVQRSALANLSLGLVCSSLIKADMRSGLLGIKLTYNFPKLTHRSVVG